MKLNKEILMSKEISIGTTDREREVIFEEVDKLPAGSTYVEIGTADGSTILLIADRRPDINCYGIELRTNYTAYPQLVELASALPNIHLYFGIGSEEVCKTWGKDIDLLFIDGDHMNPHVYWDFIGWYPYVKPGSAILFHDYTRMEYDVNEVCQIFKDHPKYNLTVPDNTYLAKIIKS